MKNRGFLVAPAAVALALGAGPASAEIVWTSYQQAETMGLTEVGTVDWCVYRVEDLEAPGLRAADHKNGGSGIGRKIGVKGRIKKVEDTQWTGVGWGWTDGTKLASHSHRQGDKDGQGCRVWLDSESALVFEFAAPPAGEQHQAHLIVRCDGRIDIVAAQGDERRKVKSFGGGKNLGVAIVRYDGARPLAIELANPDRRDQVIRGFAAALSGPVDHQSGVPRIPTRQELAAKEALKLGPIDYLKAATDFADCMIEHGRDRYGKEHSPLFAVLLTREKEPKVGPQPYFDRPSPYDTSNMKTPFRKYNFNRCPNYPGGLGGEGPHKITIFGCDVYEDRDLYEMLIDLTRITGVPKYKAEAEKALLWWFVNTLGPADLYPWGEHLGWDFEHECPTYFEGPSKHLYAACYHEIKDRVPFLDFLAAIPAGKPGERTPLERYAVGVWNAHYWDQENAVYCRHGDYTGGDRRTGSYAGFPAHQGAHLRLWVKTYLATRNAAVKRMMGHVLDRVLDVQIARAKKYGFIPFTFDPDFKGKTARKSGQSNRLGHHAAEASVAMKDADLRISAKLEELARLLLGEGKLKDAIRNMEMYLATGDRDYLQGRRDEGARPTSRVPDLSKADTPGQHAQEIIRLVQWHRIHGDEAYLSSAEKLAALAYVRFMDDKCPLPKACSGPPRKTAAGDPFPDFYFKGAKLVHAFALLGEARRRAEVR